MRQKKYFVTYNSNKNYDLSNRHLIDLIKHSNLFDGVFNLNPETYQQNLPVNIKKF